MNVTSIRLLRYRLPFRRPYVTAAGSASHRDGILVELLTDDGWTGWGESALLPHESETLPALIAATTEMAQAALGRGVEDVALGNIKVRQGPSLPEAAAGIEIAAWDALARSRNQPLCRLLAGASLERVPLNALVTALNPQDAVAAARSAIESGYRTVKLKVGMDADVETELARIAAVREAIGRGARLRLDANGAWSEDQARAVLTGLDDLTIEYIEQPVTPGRIGALKRLHEQFQTPIAADEDVANPEAALRLVEMDAVDLLVLKPVILGGLGPSLRIATAAHGAGIGSSVTSAIESGIGVMAALHLAAALGSRRAAGLATTEMLECDLLQSPPAIEDGDMLVPAEAGLGVEPDREALQRYLVDEWSAEG